MKFTLSWLKDYLETDASLDEISTTLTAIGLEVEEIVDNSEALAPFTVAKILAAEPHPNADKLRVCKVDNGKETIQIVCGAPNARAGIKVALASIGAVIPTNGMKIKQSKIRDVESCGMMCSAEELGIGSDAAGIIELPEAAEIGQPFAAFIGADDPMIEIAITPNRGDCLGVFGIARDLAAAGLGVLKSEGVTTEDFQEVLEDGSFASPISIAIDDQQKCSFFIGRTINNVTNAESPDWLKQRLESVGLHPISALVDITNYITMSFGRPSHVYDADKLSGNLVVRDAKVGEKIVALDDKSYDLADGMTVIADENAPVAIGGIIGGSETGCELDTKNVFLEVALFDPIATATTGRALQIDSDARYRFERGVGASTLKHFITITRLITDLCGGEVSKPVVAGAIPMERRYVMFDPACVSSKLGIEIERTEIERLLVNLGFELIVEGDNYKILIPSWRPDVAIAEDIVEEVARLYGYDNIPTVYLDKNVVDGAALSPEIAKLYGIKRVLSARNMHEVTSYSFQTRKDAEIFAGDVDVVELANPISADLSTMRPSILPNLINMLVKNEARGFADLALFEVGPVFHGDTPELQHRVAGGVRCGNNHAKNHYGDVRVVDAMDVKADALAVLSDYVAVGNIRVSRDVPAWYHPGRAGALCLGKAVLGYFGELHPAVAKKMDVRNTVVCFEVFPHAAPAPKKKKTTSRPKLALSNYQAVGRDFAFIVDESVDVGNILAAVQKSDRKLITEVSLFDIYQGKGVEEGKKSVAINVVLQAQDRTLVEDEIEKIASSIIATVEKSCGGQLRG